MTDDPFDFAAAGPAPSSGSPARVLTVGELSRQIRAKLEGLGRVSVEGEVTRITKAASGHLYFSLKDLDAKIDCTVWKSALASALRFELAEGARVVAHGKLDVYAPRGTYSLNVARLERAGLGEMLAKLEALKARLRADGWFDRHRPLPALPRVVGVVTSRDGAAFQDFLRTRSQRWPLYPVRLAHASVQGRSAAGEIATAVRALDASGVDVIVVCRGGGSLEDLWAFNELPVLEAIRGASVPVVSGVGHETDTTLSDLVADVRAHTPTDAAQRVIPERAALLEALERARDHLGRAIDAVLEVRERKLERLASARVLRDASGLVEGRRLRVESAGRMLASLVRARIERAHGRVGAAERALERRSPWRELERRAGALASLAPRLHSAARARATDRASRLADAQEDLDRALARAVELRAARLSLAERTLCAVSPLAVLGRGYSITTLVAASDVAPGEVLLTRLSDGELRSTVERSA